MQSNITIRKKDKGYQVIVSYKDGLKWRQKSKQGFKTQREAKEYGQRIIEELKTTVIPIDENLRNITLGDFSEIFLHEKINLAYNSRVLYKNALKSFSALLNVPLRQITHGAVIKALDGKNKAPNTINTHLRVMTAIVNYAISPYKIIAENPFKYVPRKKTEHKKIAVFTDDEMNILFANVKEKYRTMIAIAYYTGCRLGEVLAITWNDIDFAAGTLTINKQINRVGTRKSGIKPPKSSNGYRTIPIPPVLCEILTAYKNECKTPYLFPQRHNAYISGIIQKYVKGKTFHDLRHTYATKLLANGIDIKTVASLLGDNVNTVINVYIHYTDDMRMKAAQDVATIFQKNF